jgi:hypothetical protein
MNCPACLRDVPGDALVCPACGAGVGSSSVPSKPGAAPLTVKRGALYYLSIGMMVFPLVVAVFAIGFEDFFSIMLLVSFVPWLSLVAGVFLWIKINK